jgi:hypothetical protein
LVAQYVRGEAVGVEAGLLLGWGQQVHLAVGLFERLDQLVRQDVVSPGAHLLGCGMDRVPYPDAGVVGQSQ